MHLRSVGALVVWMGLAGMAPHGTAQSAPPTLPALPVQDDAEFFRQRVRGILETHCFKCHGPDARRIKGGLVMDGLPSLLRGGDSGPAVVLGQPDESRLIQAVRWSDSELEMPPSSRMDPALIQTLTEWVARGAPWPDAGPGSAPSEEHADIDVDAARERWPFRPLEQPDVPVPGRAEGVRHPIDAFVLARLEAEGLTPSPPASPLELVRRASFDLLGLPPDAELVDAFVADPSEEAWGWLIDTLLARPEYGERWGRHWLDVVRFAQTAGYERDAEIPFAWRYRDYVIQAFNDDKPFDQFILEQLAGDELDQVTDESLTATGFYRLGVWDSEPDDDVQAGFDGLDDSLRTISEGFLGLTVGCARCHDHRFDPITQEDYYGMLAFLGNVQPYEEPRYSTESATLRPLAFDREAAAAWERDRAKHVEGLKAQARDVIRALRRRLAGFVRETDGPEVRAAIDPMSDTYTQEQVLFLQDAFADDAQATEVLDAASKQLFAIETQIKESDVSFEGELEWALTVAEHGHEAPPMHLLVRGDPSRPAQATPPRFPRVASGSDEGSWPALPTRTDGDMSSGQRRALAEWLASERNPLTARVFVNRVWQHHFGRGVVATPNDFGAMGSPPSHPGLLDWLASEFTRTGWRTKSLHKLIMTSNTYRMSSRSLDEDARRADPDNLLLWRQHVRRLSAEEIHDAMLSVSGALNPQRGGRGFFPDVAAGALAGASRPGEGWSPSDESQRNRRAVYSYVKRNLVPPMFTVFDSADPSLPVATRSETTVASQALTLLNGAFANRQAAAFAERVEREAGNGADAQVGRAWQLAMSRRPTQEEQRIAVAYLQTHRTALQAEAPRWMFASRVPVRLDVDYLAQLSGSDVLVGPDAGWRYLLGTWGDDYNDTVAPIDNEYPAAIKRQLHFGDGVVRARVLVRSGNDYSALLLRSEVDEGRVTGLELEIDPAGQRLRLRTRDDVDDVDGINRKTVVHAEVACAVEHDRWFDLRVRMQGPRVRVWVDDENLIDVTDPLLVRAGRLGIRTWGEGMVFSALEVTLPEGTSPVLQEPAGSADREALQALCLALFNLNEFVHVD